MKVNRLVAIDRSTGPQEGNEYDRILQPLGFMNGDNLDQRFVVFQAQFGILAGVFLKLLLEPAQQRRHTADHDGLLLQQFGQVQQVGNAPFAVFLLRKMTGNFEAM
jgi:hypothetical protein